MNRIKILGIILVAVFINLGCSTGPNVKVTPISTDVDFSAASDDVEVFLTKNPGRQYKEIGVLETTQYSSNTGYSEIIGALTAEAKKLGADGIIMMDNAGVTSTNLITGQSYNGQTYRVMAIVYE